MPEAVEKPLNLTKAQTELLREACAPGGQRCARNYKPAVKLYTLGLVSRTEVTPPFGWHVYSTPAGRAHPAVAKA